MCDKKNFAAPCGLYCGVCGILIAHRDNNQKFKEKLAEFYGLTPDAIRCNGCLSDDVFVYCQVCKIKSCNKERGFEGCYQCEDFPCEHVNNFPIPMSKKIILRAVPQWRELGTEGWMEAEKNRYVCPHCQESLFRGARRCRACKNPVDMD